MKLIFENWREYLTEDEDVEADNSGWISTRHRGRRATSQLNLYGVPLKYNTKITPAFYRALKTAENEYREQHPEEYAEYAKLMQQVHGHFEAERAREPSWRDRRAWSSNRQGWGEVDLSRISFPEGFDPNRGWLTVSGGFMVGATGGHARHGREIDWTYGSADSSLPIPMNLQRLMNKHRISSSGKSDAGHQHHLNFYPSEHYSDRRLNRAIQRQYHVRQGYLSSDGTIISSPVNTTGTSTPDTSTPTSTSGTRIASTPTSAGSFTHGFKREEYPDFDFDKFYQELDTNFADRGGALGMLFDYGKDRRFGREHNAAYLELQRIKASANQPVESEPKGLAITADETTLKENKIRIRVKKRV
jgi:hypothetical protein